MTTPSGNKFRQRAKKALAKYTSPYVAEHPEKHIGCDPMPITKAQAMTTPTQAQIEAAAKALAVHSNYEWKAFMVQAEAALAAAAEVGQSEIGKSLALWQKNYGKLQAATIERCARVNDAKAAEIEAWSHQDTASRLAAEMLRKAAAAIRALAHPEIRSLT